MPASSASSNSVLRHVSHKRICTIDISYSSGGSNSSDHTEMVAAGLGNATCRSGSHVLGGVGSHAAI
jgi:hypothetical protein